MYFENLCKDQLKKTERKITLAIIKSYFYESTTLLSQMSSRKTVVKVSEKEVI